MDTEGGVGFIELVDSIVDVENAKNILDPNIICTGFLNELGVNRK
jgi:hypothetical protein